jgi:hypothetical protein
MSSDLQIRHIDPYDMLTPPTYKRWIAIDVICNLIALTAVIFWFIQRHKAGAPGPADTIGNLSIGIAMAFSLECTYGKYPE